MSSFSLIDSHAHLTNPEFSEDIDTILQRSLESGVTKILNICTDADSLQKGLLLSQRYPWVYQSASTTPHDVDREGEELFPLMAYHARKGDLVAVGETGLDYHRHADSKAIQKVFFVKYLHLALECDLPVVIHCRDAFDDFFEIIDAEYVQPQKGVLHCFTGTTRDAIRLVERGWYLSISGVVTFKKSAELRETIKEIPLEHLLIETDSPYLAPQSRRGKKNEPSFLPEIAQEIARIKGIPIEEVAQTSCKNTEQLFKI